MPDRDFGAVWWRADVVRTEIRVRGVDPLGLGEPTVSARGGMAWTTAAGLGCVAAQLVTFDAGIMSVIACLSALAVLALGTMSGLLRHVNFSPRRLGYIALCLVGWMAAANLVLALFFWLTARQPVGFTDYHYYSWRLIQGYNRSFGERWAVEPLCAALIVSAVLYVCISIAAGWKDWSDEQRALVVCVGALAIVGFKSAIVRAIMAKVFMSSVPLLYLAAVLVSARMTPWRFRPMEAGLCLLLVSSWPFRVGVEALYGRSRLAAHRLWSRSRFDPWQRRGKAGLFTGAVLGGRRLRVFRLWCVRDSDGSRAPRGAGPRSAPCSASWRQHRSLRPTSARRSSRSSSAASRALGRSLGAARRTSCTMMSLRRLGHGPAD